MSPHPAWRLLSIVGDQPTHRDESPLIGRSWELNSTIGLLDEATAGAGSVVTIVGPPGIGKSRLTREAAKYAAGVGIPVYTTHCESHTSDVPFLALARLLRSAMGVADLDDASARAHIPHCLGGSGLARAGDHGPGRVAAATRDRR